LSDAPHYLRFGTPAIHETATEGGEVVGVTHRPDLGARVTEVSLPVEHVERLIGNASQLDAEIANFTGADHLERFLLKSDINSVPQWARAFRHIAHVVGHHAAAGVDWVECEDLALRAALAKFFGAKEGEQPGYGQPEEVQAAALPVIAGGSVEMDEIFALAGKEMTDWPARLEAIDGPVMLKTQKGYDAILSGVFKKATRPEGIYWMQLGKSNTAVVETDKEIREPITSAEGNIKRVEATYSHAEGTKEAKVTAEWEANAKDTLPVEAKVMGLFNAASGETLCLTNVLSSAMAFNAVGDKGTVVDTIKAE
jgi:hypothetical protein